MHQADVVIVGAGPAGLGIASHIKRPFLILEKENRPGGLMRSKMIDGFTFDWAGHIFFTGIDRIRTWVEHLMGGNFHWQDRESWIYSKSTYTRYPFQANTYGLPTEVVKECLLGLIEATYQDVNTPPGNFRDWIYQTYGTGIARHFLIPYNEKIWARDLSTMDYEWLGGRVPRPGLAEFVDGALGPGHKNMGPNARFGYPLSGGIEALARKMSEPITDVIRPGTRVTGIDPARKRILTDTGDEITYRDLVLTAPLPEMIAATRDVPAEIERAARSLEHLSVLCVNVGIEQAQSTDRHWVYFPEPDFLFHRVFVQGNAAPGVCPEEYFSFTAEITYNSTKRIDFNTAGDQTVNGLIQSGLMNRDDRVAVVDLVDIPVGYVVPTHDRRPAVETIRRWYKTFDIHLAGRFAEWAYYNMDHSLDAGWTLADQLSAK
ncbi:NAD(P)-binding protein [bacterium]|nr:NAD(P)-binding protein [candidate division CSSED10-310 bacterium]